MVSGIRSFKNFQGKKKRLKLMINAPVACDISKMLKYCENFLYDVIREKKVVRVIIIKKYRN